MEQIYGSEKIWVSFPAPYSFLVSTTGFKGRVTKLQNVCCVLQKLEAESVMPVIKQERPDDSYVPAGGPRSLGSMQKVPSLSDLSDPESSLGKYVHNTIDCSRVSDTEAKTLIGGRWVRSSRMSRS
jgi:hypothetical protein